MFLIFKQRQVGTVSLAQVTVVCYRSSQWEGNLWNAHKTSKVSHFHLVWKIWIIEIPESVESEWNGIPNEIWKVCVILSELSTTGRQAAFHSCSADQCSGPTNIIQGNDGKCFIMIFVWFISFIYRSIFVVFHGGSLSLSISMPGILCSWMWMCELVPAGGLAKGRRAKQPGGNGAAEIESRFNE